MNGVVFVRKERECEVFGENAFHPLGKPPPEKVVRFPKFARHLGSADRYGHRRTDNFSGFFPVQSINPHTALEDVQMGLIGAERQIDAESGAEINDFLVWGFHGEALAFRAFHLEVAAAPAEIDGAVVDKRQGGRGFQDRANLMGEGKLDGTVVESDGRAVGKQRPWRGIRSFRCVGEGETGTRFAA